MSGTKDTSPISVCVVFHYQQQIYTSQFFNLILITQSLKTALRHVERKRESKRESGSALSVTNFIYE